MRLSPRGAFIWVLVAVVIGGTIRSYNRSNNPEVWAVEKIGERFKTSALTQRYTVDADAKN